MTAELRRGLTLAGVGLAAGFALIVVLFGPAELGRRAASVIGSSDKAAATASDGAKPSGDTAARAEPPGGGEPARPEDGKPKIEALTDSGSERKPSEQAGKDSGKDSGKAGDDGSAKAPSLDIVRVEPSGDAVIAGRTAPNASVELLRDNKPFATAKADASGNFAIVPPTLPAGNSEISYKSVAPDGSETRGKESVAVVVAENRATKPLVAVSTPDKPTMVLSQPDAVAESGKEGKAGEKTAQAEKVPAKPDDTPPQKLSALPEKPQEPKAVTGGSAEGVPLKIVSIDAQEGGRLDVTGMAKPGATLRLYLNDTLVASGKAGPDGRLAFTIGRGVRAGGYQVRVDQVDPATGKVEHRAQVAFAFPEAAAVPKVAAREPAPAVPPPPPIPAKPDADRKPIGDLASRQPAQQGETSAAAKPSAPAAEPPRAAQAPERKPEPANPKPAAQPQRQAAGSERELPVEKPAPSMSLPQPLSPPASGPEKSEPRPVAETAAAAAAPKPQASPAPTPESDRRAAEALSPKLPAAAQPEAAAPPQPTGTPAPGQPRTSASAAAAPAESSGTVFVPEIATAKITRGDNLWQISRRSYGSGVRYTVIFDANKDQIKDPDLIYPGQIFVLPKDEGTGRKG